MKALKPSLQKIIKLKIPNPAPPKDLDLNDKVIN